MGGSPSYLSDLKAAKRPLLAAFGVDRAIEEARGCLLEIAGRKAPLTPIQESTLFRGYHAALYKAASVIGRLPKNIIPSAQPLGEARESLLVSQEIKNAIGHHNITLVMAMARREGGTAYWDDEKLSEANLSFTRCIEKFDWTRGYRFSTFACRSILKAFRRVTLSRMRRQRRFIQLETPVGG